MKTQEYTRMYWNVYYELYFINYYIPVAITKSNYYNQSGLPLKITLGTQAVIHVDELKAWFPMSEPHQPYI